MELKAESQIKRACALSPERENELLQLAARLDLPCEDLTLLDSALTHRSYTAENPGSSDYERLEFFGDSVLKFVVAEYLFEQFAELDEGQLTEICAVLVSARTLEDVGRKLSLEKHIQLGRGVPMRASIIAKATEAVLGAVYWDSRFEHVRPFIIKHFCSRATAVSKDAVKENYKAQLQQITQARAQGTPVYSVLEVSGPPHDPLFNVAVLVENKVLADGSGRSKKTAEQAAAKAAVAKLNEECKLE